MAIVKHKKTAFKCPNCGWSCELDSKNNTYKCIRPIVLSSGRTGGSCGSFYYSGERIDA